MVQSKTYTDPIVYEEGFFKDEAEELAFINKLHKIFEIAIIENKAVKKGTIVAKNYIPKKRAE
jgi:hypothetical protein